MLQELQKDKLFPLPFNLIIHISESHAAVLTYT